MANVNLVAVVEGRVCDSSVTADSLVHELGKSLAIFTIRSKFGVIELIACCSRFV